MGKNSGVPCVGKLCARSAAIWQQNPWWMSEDLEKFCLIKSWLCRGVAGMGVVGDWHFTNQATFADPRSTPANFFQSWDKEAWSLQVQPHRVIKPRHFDAEEVVIADLERTDFFYSEYMGAMKYKMYEVVRKGSEIGCQTHSGSTGSICGSFCWRPIFLTLNYLIPTQP